MNVRKIKIFKREGAMISIADCNPYLRAAEIQPAVLEGTHPEANASALGPALCVFPQIRNTHRATACEQGCSPTPTSSCGGQGGGLLQAWMGEK